MRFWGRIVSTVFALALGLFPAPPAVAQTGSVSGVISDASTGQPLDAVHVTLEALGAIRARLGGLTQGNGRYLIGNLPVGQYDVRAELLGFATQNRVVDVVAGQTTVVDLRLEPEAISLSEMVVTGVAEATLRTRLPFEVAQIRVRDLPVPGLNPIQSLQGKVAGATVLQGSGRPGAAPSVLLRGVKSLNASGRDQEPLYIVDGVILGNKNTADFDAIDIQSIEVVKGAAAASLYGSRAAAGVIQIRTKRGAGIANDHVRYTLRSEYGGSELATVPEELLAKKHRFKIEDGKFVDQDGTLCDWLRCSQPQEAGTNAWNTYNDQVWPGMTYDQVRRFFTSADYLQTNLAAEGRSGRTNFYVSATYTDQEGILRFTPGFVSTNFRVNVDQQAAEALRIQTSVFYGKSSQGRPDETSGNTLFDLTRAPAGIDLLAVDSTTGDLRALMDPSDSESRNPIYELKNSRQTENRTRFLGSASVRYSPLNWLEIDSDFSYDRLDDRLEDFQEQSFPCLEAPCPTPTSGLLHEFSGRTEALNASATASAVWAPAENIRNTVRVRYLYEDEHSESFITPGYDFAMPGVPDFTHPYQASISSDSYLQTVRADGYFLIANLEIYDRYFIDGLVRNDGSSLFGEDQRRQWYSRIGGAWRISQEGFFKVPNVDELKLRYSVGTAGGRPRFDAQYPTFDASGGRLSPVTLGNKKLKPERSTETEAGIDLSMFDYGAVLTLTYAQTTTEDQILPVPQPAYRGFASQWRNAGTVQDRTWEATLDLRFLDLPAFRWSGRLLFDHTTSEIMDLDVPPFVYGVPGQQMGAVFYARKGEQVGTFYGPVIATACDQLPRGASCDGFEVNDDGLLVWTGGTGFSNPQWGIEGPVVNGSRVMWGTPFAGLCVDRTTGEQTMYCPLGRTQPEYNASVATTMTWKGLSLYALVSRSAGFSVYNQPLQWGFFKRKTGYYDQDANAEASEKKPLGYYDAWYGSTGGLGPSSLFVEDGSFTKIREVSLQFRLPGTWLGRVPGLDRFSDVRASLIGRNLYTWSDYRGYDPEVGKTGGETGSAAIARVDGYTYPNFRTWTAALEFIF